MGKTFGVLALIFGLIALLAGWAIIIFMYLFYGTYIVYALCGLAIVFGIIGIVKDDSKGLGIAGLVLGIIALIIALLMPIFLLAFLFTLFGMSLMP